MKEQLKKAMARATDAGGPSLSWNDIVGSEPEVERSGNGYPLTKAVTDPIDGGKAPLELLTGIASHLAAESQNDISSITDESALDAGPCPSELIGDMESFYDPDSDDEE